MTAMPPSRRAFLGSAGLAGVTGLAAVAGLARPARAAAEARSRPARADLALVGATLIDVRTGRARPATTVLTAGDQIVAVGRTGELDTTGVARVLDLRGKFLIPGLCDMHVHTSYEDIDLPLQIANGVTSVREMWGHPWVRQWRDEIEAGRRLGPRYTIGSQIIDGDPTLWNDPAIRPSAPIVAATPAAARAAVRSEVAAGADFVKVYSRLSPDVLRAVAQECARLAVRFGGHCPDAVPIGDAARLGMWSFEHLDGLWWETSRHRSALRRAVAAIRIDPANAYDSWFAQIGALEWTAARSYDRGRAERLFERLRESDSWQVPTLTLNRRVDIPDGSHDPRMRYVPAGDAQFWAMFAEGISATRTPEQVRQHRILFPLRQRLVGAMAAAGVPLLAGTDLGTTYQFPGFSLHDELGLLVAAGLSPAAALRTATLEPARALGLERERGTVAAGRVADLVVLDADPLAAIDNSRRIHGVVARGRWIDPSARQALLDGAAAAANPPSGASTAIRRGAGCGCRAHSRG